MENNTSKFMYRCQQCGELLPLSDYNRNSQRSCGHDVVCKYCRAKATKAKSGSTKTPLHYIDTEKLSEDMLVNMLREKGFHGTLTREYTLVV